MKAYKQRKLSTGEALPLPHSVSVKTIVSAVGLALIFNQVLVYFQSSSTGSRVNSQLISQQRETIAQLNSKHQRLLETTDVIANGFEKLWEQTKGLMPDDRQRFYSMDDFFPWFGIVPIHHTIVDPAIRKYIEAHDVTKDSFYLDDPEEMELRAQMYGTWIERGSEGDRRFYVKYVNDECGYGLFANTDIRRGDVVGVYTSHLTNNSYSTDYMWTYSSEITDESGKLLDLGLDAKEYGNWFRFVNAAAPELLNTEAIYTPYYIDHKNKGPHYNTWEVVYVATRPVRKDEELLVSYGSAYWDSRKMANSGEISNSEPSTDYAEVLEKLEMLNSL